ncbi:hypothetical protein HDV57DRAFT_195871 [Trichoderma longibrachiatum]
MGLRILTCAYCTPFQTVPFLSLPTCVLSIPVMKLESYHAPGLASRSHYDSIFFFFFFTRFFTICGHSTARSHRPSKCNFNVYRRSRRSGYGQGGVTDGFSCMRLNTCMNGFSVCFLLLVPPRVGAGSLPSLLPLDGAPSVF